MVKNTGMISRTWARVSMTHLPADLHPKFILFTSPETCYAVVCVIERLGPEMI
jgi:hypothetical protein